MRDFIVRELKQLMNANPEYTFCEVIYSVLRLLPQEEKPALRGLMSVTNESFYKSVKSAIKEEEEIKFTEEDLKALHGDISI